MIRKTAFKGIAAGFLAIFALIPEASAADPAKALVNSIDPKSINELFEVTRSQPDAALTNIAPVSANTFRFMFIWPASNSVMTYDRVGRSFAERFAAFAEQWKLLAAGFCLPSQHMVFATAPYGEEELNVAYRDIEIRYALGRQPPCQGRYISFAEVEQTMTSAAPAGGYSASAPFSPSNQTTAPQEGLKPFLNPAPAAPLE